MPIVLSNLIGTRSKEKVSLYVCWEMPIVLSNPINKLNIRYIGLRRKFGFMTWQLVDAKRAL